ncbi:general transcription factor 3C polypeptide 4 [Paramormyrops kingsleyae]|uniref:Ral transcription factor IIIC subunit 4 n=1 Tax=Paramormyrops kingsleyae TaxID=1676925 RepID=A0A3B3RYL2_9TELE|nr:general transcription factor 3C polypeptide 4 [Paramormyrops kingsleyae]
MAALSPDRAPDGETEPDTESEPEPDTDPWVGLGPIVKREPAVKLPSPVSGLEPLSWSEDHRLSASSTSSISLMEILCDVHGCNQDLVMQRTSIPFPDSICELKVGLEEGESEGGGGKETPDSPESQCLSDSVKTPGAASVPPQTGFKYTSWSPLGCDTNGRCLLASLTLDNRLTVYGNLNRLQWTALVDLTELYGEMLEEKGYSLPGAEPPLGPLEDLPERQRRRRMQSPVRMEWSSVCTTQQVQMNNECKDVGTVLLAVLMENGDLAIWQFKLPFEDKDSVLSCNTIQSGVSAPSVLAWWEYEHSGRKMSGLIVGSSVGPVRILPVNLKAVKGYFTLRQPVVLWQETDQIPVHNIKCISLFHPYQKCNCSLVVAARGSHLFWCLLLISKAGLNVHNSHVTGLHTTPIMSMTASRYGGSIFTCSADGVVKKLTPIFTDMAVMFKQEEINMPEGVIGSRLHGIGVSPNGAYLALVTTEGVTNGQVPVSRAFQVQFITLKTPDDAAAELLESMVQNLFKQTDLLDLVRWKVLRDRRIPPMLQEELDDKVHATGSTYLWRFKLFLFRVLYQSLQKMSAESHWLPSHEDTKVFIVDEEGEDNSEDSPAGASASGGVGLKGPGGGASDEQMSEVIAWIEAVESHLTREHMKRVLGEVYLHTWITENTSIPTRGVCDFLMSDPTYEDRAARVLIGHIFKKMNKQTFPEYCSLCKEVLPFTDRRQAVCCNGHIWLRCVLSYQACQTLTFRRCLLQDSIARYPVPEDPDWIKRILQGPCTFCDSPLF